MVADWKQDLDQCRTKNRELIDLKGADTIDAQILWLRRSVMGRGRDYWTSMTWSPPYFDRSIGSDSRLKGN